MTVAYAVNIGALRSPAVGESAHAQAVREFVASEYGRVVGAVTMAVGSRDLAEDAVQDALVKVLRDRHRPDRMGAWVTVVAINEARQVIRRRGAEARAVNRAVAVPRTDPFHEVEIGGSLREALSGLPERQRDAVLLHYFLDYSVAEAAAALGVDVGTIKTHLHRARAALSDVIGEEDPR